MKTTMRSTVLVLLALAGAAYRPAAAQQIVTLDTPSPLVEIRIMVRAGSTADPAGKEGLAALTARTLLQGGYGDPARPVTKEDLANITRPWGARAQPSVIVEKETSTFVATVPADVLDRYLTTVLGPLFGKPLFDEKELARLRDESLTQVGSSLRLENVEALGLEALDEYVLAGTSYEHPIAGTVEGLKALTRDDARAFYARFYRPDNMILGLSTARPDVAAKVKAALAGAGAGTGATPQLAFRQPTPPAAILGREALIVTMPRAGATGLHAGFPLAVTRKHPDYWPLYVANIYLGTHRDRHGLLYQEIRDKRGYNYGDYSYMEHFAGRSGNLFPPFNTPRTNQYFSLWVRPIDAAFAPHLLKAVTYELENLVKGGVSADDVALSKNKARNLYLNLAETTSRLLQARMDDAFFGNQPGYLEAYLASVAAVTPDAVNAAVRKHLQADNLKYTIVTDADKAEGIATTLRSGGPAFGKTAKDYQLEVDAATGAVKGPPEKLALLKQDTVWANYPLRLDPARVKVVPSSALFETGKLPLAAKPAAGTK